MSVTVSKLLYSMFVRWVCIILYVMLDVPGSLKHVHVPQLLAVVLSFFLLQAPSYNYPAASCILLSDSEKSDYLVALASAQHVK